MKYYHLQWDLLASYWQCEILKSHLNCIEALLHCQQSRRGLRACVNAFHNFPHVFQPNILEHLFKSLCLFQLNWKQFCTLNKPHSHYWAFSWFVKTREEKVQRVLIAVFSYLMSDYTEDSQSLLGGTQKNPKLDQVAQTGYAISILGIIPNLAEWRLI